MASSALLPAEWQIPELFRRRLGDSVGRQRLMREQEHLLLVLHAPPGPDEDQRLPRLFWREPNGQWHSSLAQEIPALQQHVSSFDALVATIDRAEEEATTSEDYFEVLERLAPVYRAARHLHQVLEEARLACPDDRPLLNARDQAYQLERTAELLYNNAKHLLDYTVARRAEEQARSSHRMAVSAHRLNVLAAFFFPLATLSAMFGANLLHGLEELPAPGAFIGVLACGLFAGMILTYFITRDS